MKAERKTNAIISIKKSPDNSRTIENALVSVIKSLSQLKASCEDRNLEKFPTEEVKKIIENFEVIKMSAEDILVDKEYFDTVIRTKEVSRYYLDKFEQLKQEETKFKKKKEQFKKFHSMLRKLYEE